MMVVVGFDKTKSVLSQCLAQLDLKLELGSKTMEEGGWGGNGMVLDLTVNSIKSQSGKF